MKIDIFDEINKELKKQKRKSPWLADEVGKSHRNMHGILNSRKDIYIGDVTDISIALKKNFFKLYVPFVDAAISAAVSNQNETSPEEITNLSHLTLKVKFPEAQLSEIGIFIKQVKLLAKEYGYEIDI